ncbi:hypothetical protein LSTR_LSTR008942 [Laodelphax striatellus]|uniref:Uncharacterized protein n=1 Tax=Laodelphax striatellus TaxID=195883 RepID=A0A482WRD3_LAOST|nr:hypothetical protein LSTR_LSTR008942 [Laodelphax striatellus]
MALVEETWRGLAADIGASGEKATEWWTKLVQAYSEDRRKFHNINYLAIKLENYETIKCKLKNRSAVGIAIFFHHFEYDPKMVDCFKKNLEHFDNFANDCGITSDSDLYKSVVDLLESVDTHSTDEHKTDGVYGADDCHYFLDLDMVILGSDAEYYATEYATNIQAEYDFLPDTMYKGLRLKVLQSFLQIPNIFATKEFREKYEQKARANIQKEVEKLK